MHVLSGSVVLYSHLQILKTNSRISDSMIGCSDRMTLWKGRNPQLRCMSTCWKRDIRGLSVIVLCNHTLIHINKHYNSNLGACSTTDTNLEFTRFLTDSSEIKMSSLFKASHNFSILQFYRMVYVLMILFLPHSVFTFCGRCFFFFHLSFLVKSMRS